MRKLFLALAIAIPLLLHACVAAASEPEIPTHCISSAHFEHIFKSMEKIGFRPLTVDAKNAMIMYFNPAINAGIVVQFRGTAEIYCSNRNEKPEVKPEGAR